MFTGVYHRKSGVRIRTFFTGAQKTDPDLIQGNKNIFNVGMRLAYTQLVFRENVSSPYLKVLHKIVSSKLRRPDSGFNILAKMKLLLYIHC